MIADLVSFRDGAGQDLRMPLGVFAQHEEGRFDFLLREQI
jgi:hypothetical protein